tara:strand:+ start:12119 stop:12337 length:219 start_codon:yes stop_codon:yes gene_type:complete
MGLYGTYTTAIEHYNSLNINDKCKVFKENDWHVGTVIRTECLGVNSRVIQIDSNSIVIAIFPNNADKIRANN